MKIGEASLIDYLAGELNADQQRAVENALKKSADLRRQLEALRQLIAEIQSLEEHQPSSSMRQRFDLLLEKESGRTRVVNLRNWSAAIAGAAAILALGIFLGLQIQTSRIHQKQMAAIQAELEATRQQMNRLLATNSTAKRIQAVNMSLEAPKADQEMIDQLIELLHKDESTNVRLAAIEALLQLTQGHEIQQALTSALRTENKPVVQIALIHALVRVKAEDAVPLLNELIENEETFDKVKDEARLGKFKLS